MKFLCTISICLPVTFAAVADVTSVNFHQDPITRRVRIDYTLDAPAIVTVDFLTNGVSIGTENFRGASGDVNRFVKAPGGSIEWQPAATNAWPGYKITDGSFQAVVTAWATNAPPDYMAIDLNAASNVFFYVSEAALPYHVTNDIWKTEWLLMKRIHAANVIWRMGSPVTELDRTAANETPHLVRLTEDYYMGVYMVTQRQYYLFSGGLRPSTTFMGGDQRCPVNSVKFSAMRGSTYSWPADGHKVTADSAFGKLRAHSGIDSFDMPTEAQWEYACRAGTGSRLYDGTDSSNTLTDLGWYGANSAVNGTTSMHPVGLKQPNGWGLYDLYGNSFDLCLDFNEPYVITDLVTVDPVGAASGTYRVSRGGSCDHAQKYLRSAARNSAAAEGSSYYQALRLVCAARIGF